MSRFADLHLHTCFSDGTYSPEELARAGAAQGLSILALTDHDTVEGCARMHAACTREGIEFVPGTELTAEIDGHEMHLLGYYVDIHNPPLLAATAKFQEVRQERIRQMVERLNQLNIPLQAEAVFALANCRSPGRPHVARALVEAGLCSGFDEAFDRFLKYGKPAWVPKYKMSAPDAIELIHQAGGAAVMAHPGLNHLDEAIPALKHAGLDGLECFHSRHTPAQSSHYLAVAAQHGLLITGGSDCHGMNKGRPLIGSVRLPSEQVEKLRDCAMKRALERGIMIAASPNVSGLQPS